MWFFDTFLGLVALIVSGLIGATITFLLMHLGLPKQTEECITFHDEDRDDQLKEAKIRRMVRKAIQETLKGRKTTTRTRRTKKTRR